MADLSTGVLFILGIGVFAGILGAWFFQKIKVPQVMGYVTIGILLGMSGFKIVTKSEIETLQPFNLFALGIIGFLVGGELKLSVFKKYAKQFTAILLGEGTTAFLFVTIGTGTIIYYVSNNPTISIASGIVFGAIASATDPASTISVLWENRSKGVLTTSITAIVALDDALAMTLYGLGTAIAQILANSGGSISDEMIKVSIELFGAIILGSIFGFILSFLLKAIDQKEKNLTLSLGLLLLLISISDTLKLDVILSSMTAGFVLINHNRHLGESLLQTVREFSVPIYALFFVFVGARLEVNAMPMWLWAIVIVYVIGRSLGKIIGAYLGAKITNADEIVQKNLGLGIMAQGGVAVGLSIVASHHLRNINIADNLSAGDAIIYAVTATTLIAQMIGPPLTKLAIKIANEVNKEVTKDDIINQLNNDDVLDTNYPVINEKQSISEALQSLSNSDYKALPVLDAEKNVLGIISFDDMKELIFDRDSWEWLIVRDVINNNTIVLTNIEPLTQTIKLMRENNIDEVPITSSETNKYLGMINNNRVSTVIAKEMLNRS